MVATLLGWKSLWEKAMGLLWALPVLRPTSQRVSLSIISGFYAFEDGQYSNSKHYAYSSISWLSTSKGIYWLPMQDKSLIMCTNAPSTHFPSSLENDTVFLSSDIGYLCNVKWHSYTLNSVTSSLVEYFSALSGEMKAWPFLGFPAALLLSSTSLLLCYGDC